MKILLLLGILILVKCHGSPTQSCEIKEPEGKFFLFKKIITGPLYSEIVNYDTTGFTNYISFNPDKIFIDEISFKHLDINFEVQFNYEFSDNIVMLTSDGFGELEVSICWEGATLRTLSTWSNGSGFTKIFNYYKPYNN